MSKSVNEFPGNSPQKRRNPQSRDYMAAALARMVGGGLSYARSLHVSKKANALREQGHVKEGDMLAAALDVSKRGAYEIAKLSDEAIFALCEMVSDGDARNVVEARRFLNEAAKKGLIPGIDASKPVTLARAKNDMYRITSLRNHSSVLVSAQDLIELSDLLLYIMPELQEKAEQE